MEKIVMAITLVMVMTVAAQAEMAGSNYIPVTNVNQNSPSAKADANASSHSSAVAGAAAIQGQKQAQTNKQTATNTTNEGKTRTVAIGVANSTPAAQGTDAFSTFLAGWSKTSEYVGDDAYFKDAVIAETTIITGTDSKGNVVKQTLAQSSTHIQKVLNRMEWSTKPNRLFGFLYKTRGLNLASGFGLLSWPSWRDND